MTRIGHIPRNQRPLVHGAAVEAIRMLLTRDFPTTFDVFAVLKDEHWKELEQATDQNDITLERSAYSWLLGQLGSFEFFYNSFPSLIVDFLGFKIGDRSLVDYLRNNRERFSKMPTRILVEPKIDISKDIDRNRKQLLFFGLYSEIRVLLGIIDVCLLKDPSLLNNQTGIAWIFDVKRDLYRALINTDPIFLQTVGFLYRIKFGLNLWQKNGDRISAWISESRTSSKRTKDLCYIRRALFFCLLFEAESTAKLANKDLMNIFSELGIGTTSAQTLKEERKRIEAVFALVG